MIITAHLRSLRIAPRKVRSVVRVIKGLDAVTAQHQLRYLTKRSSHPLVKLLDSALANARNNHSLVRENMRIKDIIVGGGPVFKRFEPKGFGSVSPIAKRTSHITLVLEEKVPGLKAERKVKEEKIEKTIKTEEAKPEIKKEIGPKEGRVKSFARKFFRRKSI